MLMVGQGPIAGVEMVLKDGAEGLHRRETPVEIGDARREDLAGIAATVRSGLGAGADERPDVLEREPDRLALLDEPDSGHGVVAKSPGPARGPMQRGQQTLLLVIPERLHGHTRGSRHLADGVRTHGANYCS